MISFKRLLIAGLLFASTANMNAMFNGWTEGPRGGVRDENKRYVKKTDPRHAEFMKTRRAIVPYHREEEREIAPTAQEEAQDRAIVPYHREEEREIAPKTSRWAKLLSMAKRPLAYTGIAAVAYKVASILARGNVAVACGASSSADLCKIAQATTGYGVFGAALAIAGTAALDYWMHNRR